LRARVRPPVLRLQWRPQTTSNPAPPPIFGLLYTRRLFFSAPLLFISWTVVNKQKNMLWFTILPAIAVIDLFYP
ncbi:hypothetical protein, partial [Corynebacterium diphtheriae]|uniref:hypothetical protein n=1 Tax=Corynebacterium diphtheriae TaxID=1717 RepID=UPI001C70B9DA